MDNKITFGTIFDFLVDCRVLFKKVSHLESIADRRADVVTNQEHEADSSEDEAHESSNDRLLVVPVEYTRTLEKAYYFYKDCHVQKVKYHPMPKQNDHICITANVLPSMKKHRMYKVVIIIILCETTVKISTAYCSCPAGLAGCCNHISATLYCLEDYISQRLYEERGCTERLQVWNQSQPPNVEPCPTEEVKLTKHVMCMGWKKEQSCILLINGIVVLCREGLLILTKLGLYENSFVYSIKLISTLQKHLWFQQQMNLRRRKLIETSV